MSSITVSQAFVSKPGEGQPLPGVGRLRVSSTQTGGEFEVIDLVVPGGSVQGPPPHVHHERDECFYIVEGAFTFLLGTEEVEVPVGSLVFVPRGMRHAFKASAGARTLGFAIPAGLEGFFRELGEGMRAGRPDAELRAELASKYDSEPVE